MKWIWFAGEAKIVTISMRTYFIVIAVLAAITAIPLLQLPLLPFFFAYGYLAAYLIRASIVSNTVLLYSVLLLPVVWIRRLTIRNAVYVIASLLAAGLVGYGLPKVAEHRLAGFIAEKRATRVDEWSPIKPRSIAFVSDNPSYVGMAWQHGRPIAECGSACQGLLYRRDVEKVVATFLPSDSGKALTTAYRIELRATCDIADWKRWIHPAVQSRIASGECLVASDSGDAELVDATIIDVGSAFANHDENLELASWPRETGWAIDRLHTVAVYAGGRRTGRLMLRDYEIEGWHYAAPLHFVIETGDCLPCGIGIATESKELKGAVGLPSVLAGRFGFLMGIGGLDVGAR